MDIQPAKRILGALAAQCFPAELVARKHDCRTLAFQRSLQGKVEPHGLREFYGLVAVRAAADEHLGPGVAIVPLDTVAELCELVQLGVFKCFGGAGF